MQNEAKQLFQDINATITYFAGFMHFDYHVSIFAEKYLLEFTWLAKIRVQKKNIFNLIKFHYKIHQNGCLFSKTSRLN